VVTDPGSGYTSAPTVSFSGGGGTAGAATSYLTKPMFYSRGSAATGVSFDGIQVEGRFQAGGAGIILHNAPGAQVHGVHAYAWDTECLWLMDGAGAQVSSCKLFGAARQGASLGYRTGAVRWSGTDLQMTNMETGGSPSTDQTNLWNASYWLEGDGAMISNVIGQGADVGMVLACSNGRLANARADFGYGHGFVIGRVFPGAAPAQRNYLTTPWGFRNSRYATNMFDNFVIDGGNSNAFYTRLVSPLSANSAADAWTHRYGLRDIGGGSTVSDFADTGAGTGASVTV